MAGAAPCKKQTAATYCVGLCSKMLRYKNTHIPLMPHICILSIEYLLGDSLCKHTCLEHWQIHNVVKPVHWSSCTPLPFSVINPRPNQPLCPALSCCPTSVSCCISLHFFLWLIMHSLSVSCIQQCMSQEEAVLIFCRNYSKHGQLKFVPPQNYWSALKNFFFHWDLLGCC